MADIAAEVKETQASPEKQVEKKEKPGAEKEVEEENEKVAENGSDAPKENGTTEATEDSADGKEAETTENGDSTDSTEVTACKRKSDPAGGDADAKVDSGASPEKKAKLEEKPVENGEAEAVA